MTATKKEIEEGAKALAKLWGEDWECTCTLRKGLNCDCGSAMQESHTDRYDDFITRSDCRAAAKAVLETQTNNEGSQ